MLPLRRVRRGEARFLYASSALLTSTPTWPAVSMALRTPTSVATSARTNDPPIRAAVVPAGLLVQIGDDHAHAFRRKSLRDSGTYPVRAARHQGASSLKVHGGIVRRGTDNSVEQVRMTLRERSRR